MDEMGWNVSLKTVSHHQICQLSFSIDHHRKKIDSELKCSVE